MKNNKKLTRIWQQVPVDYYERGITNNILQRLWHNRKITAFKNLVNNRNFGKILDVGCASGTLTNKISKLFPKSIIVAVDVYDKAINYGRGKYPHIKFVRTDAQNLPFKDNFFDLVICYETIEHVQVPDKVLRELKRVIKKDGLIIVAMDSGNLLFRIVWWFWEKSKGKVWQDAHLHPFHHNELEQIIRKMGFKIVKKHFSHLGMEVLFLLKK